MLSMTGFGKAETLWKNHLQIVAEISSVNRKQFELRLNLPPEFSGLEALIRNKLAAVISRGSVQVKILLRKLGSGGTGGAVRIDQDLLLELVKSCKALRAATGLDPEVAVETLLSVPGVVQMESPDVENPDFVAAIDAVLTQAIERFQSMRAAEGRALKADLGARLTLLTEILAEIEPLVENVPQQIKERLLTKLKAEKLPVVINDELLLKEVLFYADKADVTEEITRLKSHFEQFRRFFDADAPSGRSMDFLIQESFREITTLGNKSGSAGVSPLLVKFKSELEKMREQIQNVE